MRLRSLLVIALALAATASKAELQERRARGPFLGFAAGGGILDAGALYTAEEAANNAITNLGLLDVSLRAGWRFPVVPEVVGLAPIAELRGGIVLGSLEGALIGSWAALAGGQVQFKPGAEVMPYLNLRGGVRSVQGNTRRTIAIGLGIELPFGPYSSLLELTAEPLAPWLVSFRAGVLFF